MRRARGPQPESEEPGPTTAAHEQLELELELEDVEAASDNPQLRRPTRVIVSN